MKIYSLNLKLNKGNIMNTKICQPECETSNQCSNELTKNTNENYAVPEYTVNSQENGYEVSVRLPGVKSDDTEITLEKKRLTIKALKNQEFPEAWKRHSYEIRNENYHLELDLNFDFKPDAIKATQRNGVLSIHLPLAEEAKPKKIVIQ